MNLLILKSFNNYANRIALRYDTLDLYKQASEAYFDFKDINFNPADGVNTEVIIGSENQQKQEGQISLPLDWEFSGSPDYLICYVGTDAIKSR